MDLSTSPQTATAILARLGLGSMTAGALAVAASATAFAPLAHPAATGQILTSSTGTALAWSGTGFTYASDTLALIGSGGITSRQAATQDAVRLLGRAGGTTSLLASITSAALTASRTATLPDADITFAGINLAQTWSATQSFAAISASGQITSTVATGTAPLVIASTTVVANLNASALGGATFAAPGAIGGGTPAAISCTTLSATGTVTVPNGTATAPGIRTTTYAHGMHSIDATSAGIDVAGALVLTVGATASSFASGTTVSVLKATPSSSGSTGSLIVSGGIAANAASYFLSIASGYAMQVVNTNTGTAPGLFVTAGRTTDYALLVSNAADTANLLTVNGSGVVSVPTATDASAIGTAAFVDTGGASIARSAWIGGTAGDYINIANSTGELRVNGTRVLGAQGAAVADAGAASGTATSGGYGFVDAAEFNAAIAAINAIKDQMNAHLARARAHGYIAT